MARSVREFDVLIVGAGPAGATAASCLASWGRSVAVLHRELPQPSLAESLPASARKLFDLAGQAERVSAARFLPNEGNVSEWAGQSHEASFDVPGYHVVRARFDEVLRRHARSTRARILRWPAGRVTLSQPYRIEYTTTSGAAAMIVARCLLDCSGRAGSVARRGLRRAPAYRTLALVAEWECAGWPRREVGRAFVESYRDGWAWSVPSGRHRRQCTVMIDPARRQRRRLADLYLAEIAKAVHLSARLERARQMTAVWACDASPYNAHRYEDSGALLVGDAASFIDPISSAGVKKALTSAWRAAIVVNTVLDRPEMASAALGFHENREHTIYAQFARQAAAFFQAAAGAHEHPFWDVRAATDARSPASGELTDDDLAAELGVRQVFTSLRGVSRLRLQNAALAFGLVPCIEGQHVVLREGIVLPGTTTPLRFAAGVNLPELARLAPGCTDIPTLLRTYERRVGKATATGVLAGVSLLIARGVLESSGSR
jgi:flavin-dependent dehydrogenase